MVVGRKKSKNRRIWGTSEGSWTASWKILSDTAMISLIFLRISGSGMEAYSWPISFIASFPSASTASTSGLYRGFWGWTAEAPVPGPPPGPPPPGRFLLPGPAAEKPAGQYARQHTHAHRN